MDATHESSPVVQPLAYASEVLERRYLFVTFIAIASLCVACLSLFVNLLVLGLSIREMRQINQGPLQTQQFVQRLAARRAAAMTAATTQSSPLGNLTPLEISRTLDYIDKILTAPNSAQPLNAAQRNALKTVLADPKQRFIDPSIPLGSQTPGKLQFIRAWPSGNHSVLIAANHGSPFNIFRFRIDADGHISAFPTAPSHAFLPPPVFPGVNAAQNIKMVHWQYVSALFSSVVFAINAVLAILLLAAGAILLISKHRGVRLHWVYVFFKLPLSVLAGTPIFTTYMPSPFPLTFPLGTPFALIGCLYPIVLLIVLSGRKFKTRSVDIVF